MKAITKKNSTKISKAAASLVIFLLVFVICGAPLAAPALDRCSDISGLRICPDHKNRTLWYLFPPKITIALREDGTPEYHLSMFHYAGRKGTGDEERFYAKGILTVTVERRRDKSAFDRIRKVLRRRGIFYPRFRSIPVKASNIRLVFGDSVMESGSGTRWAGNTLTLPLSDEMTMILASALDKGMAHVILMIDEEARGVKRVNGRWEEAMIPCSQSLTIDLDPHRFPSNFTRTPLERDMEVAYTSIEVRSYDMEEHLVPGLYSEDVEIAVKVPGGEEVKRVHFTGSTSSVQSVSFSRAADMDQPYRVRVNCIYRDGRVVEGRWMEKKGEAVLDIKRCMPQNIDSFTLDAEEIQ